MTGPGGMMTDRDRRREARKQQLQRQQSQRQAQRRQAIRTQRIQRGSIIGGAVLILVLIGLLVAHTVTSGTTTSTPKVIAGMHCEATPGSAEHLETYVELYANDQQQTIPTGIGIDTAAKCSYPLTVQPGQANVITTQSSTKTSYTLGQFFDVWGQPLSGTQVAQHAATGGGNVTVEMWDAQGTFSSYHGDPRTIPLSNHETIAILVDSPNAHPLPYGNWSSVTK